MTGMDTYIDNEFPSISELENPWRTHFGVIPEFDHINERRIPIIDCGFNEDNTPRRHDDPSSETMLWRAPGVTAWVSGSWKCWGEQDQETEGDQSLHVVVFTPERPTEKQLFEFYDALRLDVHDGEGAVVEHAFITRRDDSEVFAVVTFGSDLRPMIWDVKEQEETIKAAETLDILFRLPEEASAVLHELKTFIRQNGRLRLSDVYDKIGVLSNLNATTKGWLNLNGAAIAPLNGNYELKLPLPLRLP